MKPAVIVFPASNCDRDAAVAIEKICGVKPLMVWHGDSTLPDVDLIVIPGGFSFGDYLRCGAMAARSPVMREVERFQPDVITMDIQLPHVSGLKLIGQLRRKAETRAIPIIMLSARSEEMDRIRGLDTGADDYISKPYSIPELIARIRVQLRRVRPVTLGQALEFGPLRLDPETHRVHHAGAEVKLGPTEFRLLTVFMERPGRVFSREALLDRVWGRDIYVESRTVDVHVGRLRKALTETGAEDPIRTVRGSGYSLG